MWVSQIIEKKKKTEKKQCGQEVFSNCKFLVPYNTTHYLVREPYITEIATFIIFAVMVLWFGFFKNKQQNKKMISGLILFPKIIKKKFFNNS